MALSGITILGSSLLLLSLRTSTLPQTPPADPSPLPALCGLILLPLHRCEPFVQGTLRAPTVQCCDYFKWMYELEHNCTCVFLSGKAWAPLSNDSMENINKLPGLCSLHIDTSTCPGAGEKNSGYKLRNQLGVLLPVSLSTIGNINCSAENHSLPKRNSNREPRRARNERGECTRTEANN